MTFEEWSKESGFAEQMRYGPASESDCREAFEAGRQAAIKAHADLLNEMAGAAPTIEEHWAFKDAAAAVLRFKDVQ